MYNIYVICIEERNVQSMAKCRFASNLPNLCVRLPENNINQIKLTLMAQTILTTYHLFPILSADYYLRVCLFCSHLFIWASLRIYVCIEKRWWSSI